ncbi:MAG TPA: SemiSWEET family transporter [Methanolinea sp.]|jgi:MtN3 and saliva related transmembrane protein|nr:SemiSWEET family transporter [Methanolinea sp.]MDI6899143.1 SemiSWEET family transporter [Methanolinea sp.]HOS82538.1 SemiSWEET family transporter [Methanolinea sp.]HPC55050.1 SemiSWEET family transporter [Methanolinea sp.]HQE85536.1 SemiSWEET family transporter [Methanolinea sp.]
MDLWFIVGGIAAMLTTFGFVPQIHKMIRTRSVDDVSPLTFVQFMAGVSLWALYGAHIGDVIVLLANIVTFGTLIVAVSLYFYLRPRKDGD